MSDKRIRLLIIDDEPGIRNVLQTRFEKQGYLVDVAANGLHGLQKIKSGYKPHLVICDIKMSGMTGIELIEKVKADSDHNKTPFFVMTAFPEKPLIVKTLKSGINGIIIKPFDFKELLKKVEEFLIEEAEPVKIAA